MQPLLELVEHDQHFLVGRNALPSPQRRQCLLEAEVAIEGRTPLSQAMQETRLGIVWCGLDVNDDHVRGKSRQQPRLDERRLAAARRPINQADHERMVGIGFLDARLPEPQPLGQSLSITGAGQQLEKEVGVMSVKRPQAFRHDLDEPVVRGARTHGSRRPACRNRPKSRPTVTPCSPRLRGERTPRRAALDDRILGHQVPQVFGHFMGR